MEGVSECCACAWSDVSGCFLFLCPFQGEYFSGCDSSRPEFKSSGEFTLEKKTVVQDMLIAFLVLSVEEGRRLLFS